VGSECEADSGEAARMSKLKPMPELFEDAARAVERVHQTPYEFMIGGFITAIATASCRYNIRLGKYDNRCTIWCCIVNRTGGGKTPALNAALKPLQKYQLSMDKKAAERAKAYRIALARHKIAFAEQVKNVMLSDADLEAEPELELTEHRLINDSTYEALLKAHEGIGGLCLFADELNGWLQSFSRYSSNARSGWLEIWGESESVKSNRVTEGHSRMVERPCVSVIGGIQPRLLNNLKDGLDDGLSHRLLYIFPPNANMADRIDSGHLSGELAYQAYERVLTAYLDLEESATGISNILSTNGASAAINAWINNGNQIYGKSTDLESDEDKEGMWAKLQYYAHRLSGIHAIMRCLSDNASNIKSAVDQLRNGYQIEVQDVEWATLAIDHLFIPSAERAMKIMLTAEDKQFERRMPSNTEVQFLEACPRDIAFEPYSSANILRFRNGVDGWEEIKLDSIKRSIRRIIKRYDKHFERTKEGFIYTENPYKQDKQDKQATKTSLNGYHSPNHIPNHDLQVSPVDD